jgi:hypothetical protein
LYWVYLFIYLFIIFDYIKLFYVTVCYVMLEHNWFSFLLLLLLLLLLFHMYPVFCPLFLFLLYLPTRTVLFPFIFLCLILGFVNFSDFFCFLYLSSVYTFNLGFTNLFVVYLISCDGVLGFDSRRGLGTFLFTASRTALKPTQPPIQWVQGALSLGVKRSGREADHSTPSSAEVKEWVELYFHSSNTPWWRGTQLKKKHRDNFTFFQVFTCSYCWDIFKV